MKHDFLRRVSIHWHSSLPSQPVYAPLFAIAATPSSTEISKQIACLLGNDKAVRIPRRSSSADQAQRDDAEEEGRGLGDGLSAADHGGDEGVDIQTVDDLVVVHIGFLLVWTAEEHFDKRLDVEAVHFAIEVQVAEQRFGR
jgi:hypothetical protein